eukprot:TRINITY_DN629_c2_g1_i1.p1 TRINITY_DN629_c2_g1~~TRINITY_DN629_c2_g1_i1.p1  ORF type:complete len:737 (-),score=230.99 TRINITY_DN629_c2_g1_i1:67-2277(-)
MENNLKKRKLEEDINASNEENGIDEQDRKKCYCGKEAPIQQNIKYLNTKKKLSLDLETRSLKCRTCERWIHLGCIRSKLEHVPLSGDYCYQFTCSDCHIAEDKSDLFIFSTKKWSDVSIIALYNVWLLNMIESHDSDIINGRKERNCYFKINDVIAFIDKNWNALCTGRERTKTWGATINSTISTRAGDNGGFYKGSSELDLELGLWSLASYVDLPQPYKDYVVPQTPTKTKKSKPVSEKKPKAPRENYDENPRFRHRGDEKPEEENWMWFPRNYDPAYFIQYIGKQILCPENSAKLIKIEKDGRTVSNEGGYRVARSSYGLFEGSCYFEVKLLPSEKEPSVRIGWSMRFGDVESPVGFDDFSYSYVSKSGKKYHKSILKNYGESFKAGDIIGCLIDLPPKEEKIPSGLIVSPQTKEQLIKNLLPNKGSKISFYKNNVFQGDAYTDINHGLYYPSVSIFTGSVEVCFGPPNTSYLPLGLTLDQFKFALDLPSLYPLPFNHIHLGVDPNSSLENANVDIHNNIDINNHNNINNINNNINNINNINNNIDNTNFIKTEFNGNNNIISNININGNDFDINHFNIHNVNTENYHNNNNNNNNNNVYLSPTSSLNAYGNFSNPNSFSESNNIPFNNNNNNNNNVYLSPTSSLNAFSSNNNFPSSFLQGTNPNTSTNTSNIFPSPFPDENNYPSIPVKQNIKSEAPSKDVSHQEKQNNHQFKVEENIFADEDFNIDFNIENN